ANLVVNSGVIRAEGGELDFNAPGNTNAAAGQIQAATGNTVFFTQGLTSSAGLISLTGGAFDNNTFALSNTGRIEGRGTIRTGGLTNMGTISFADGPTDVFGAVTNNNSIKITNCTTTFFDFVNNASGTIKTTSAIARYLA